MLISGSDSSSVLEDEVSAEAAGAEILEQLQRVVGSSLFRNSRRYSPLLRYIVEGAVSGRVDGLKERTLGICVFSREPDYDSNADPVVRVSAGEVRRRLAQYYQMRGHEQELRIEIPLGSYQPRFYRASAERWGARPLEELFHEGESSVERASAAHPAGLGEHAPDPATATPSVLLDAQVPLLKTRQTARRSIARLHLPLLYTLLFLALAALGLMNWQAHRKTDLSPSTALFWGPFLSSPESTLIVLGVHSFDAIGNDISYRSHAVLPQTQQTLLSAMTRSDMVHLSDLTSYAALTTLLTHHNHPFRTQGAADVTLEQLRQGPFVLLGGFNNLWTTKITQKLRFRFVTLPGGRNVIQDSLNPERIWTVDTSQQALSNTRDYAMVSSFFDPQTEQYVLLAGGIGKSGTEAASDFLTSEHGLESWLASTKTGTGDNVQVLLATDVIEGKAGSPQVVDFARW